MYVQWIKRFILCHNETHPADMGKEEVRAFLAYLAVDEGVPVVTETAFALMKDETENRRIITGPNKED